MCTNPSLYQLNKQVNEIIFLERASQTSSDLEHLSNSRLRQIHFVSQANHVAVTSGQLANLSSTVDAAPVFLWSAVEVSIGICVAGILEMGPLMRKWNVKGFEDYSVFASLGDDDTKPMNLKDIDFKRPVLVHTSSIRRPTNDLWQF